MQWLAKAIAVHFWKYFWLVLNFRKCTNLSTGLIHAHVQTNVALLQSPRFSVVTILMYCLR